MHVIAGGLGVSAIILASAELFTALKFAGAIYLIWLGIRTFREARHLLPEQIAPVGSKRAFRDGVLVEALNPKTAAFFLAFIPQFLDPAGNYPALQFMTLGLVSVALNTLVDFIVVLMASTAQSGLVRRPRLFQRLQTGIGAVHRRARGFAGAGAPARELAISAENPRMHPPCGVMASDLLRGTLGVGGILIDRKAGGT